MTSPALNTQEESLPEKNLYPVFVVDDDQAYLAAVAFKLMKEGSGAKVYCYKSGEECLRNMDLNPTIIILDYFLDGANPAAISGVQALKKIKQVRPDVKVVMLSGQGDLNVAIESYEAGAYAYVVKDKLALTAIEKLVEDLLAQEEAR